MVEPGAAWILDEDRRADEPEPAPFDFGGWRIDPVELAAQRGDDLLELTRREADILSLLVRDARRIVSRRRLLHEVWGYANA